MSPRTDHAATARGAVTNASGLLKQHDDGAAGAMATIAVAEATLALAEQQRIANILSAAHLPADTFAHHKMTEIREALGL